jgi:hypothetical protein
MLAETHAAAWAATMGSSDGRQRWVAMPTQTALQSGEGGEEREAEMKAAAWVAAMVAAERQGWERGGNAETAAASEASASLLCALSASWRVERYVYTVGVKRYVIVYMVLYNAWWLE